jgi:hydrogenase expression/formation protein HypC
MCLAVPGKIASVAGDDDLNRTARVSFNGVERTVSLACLPEAGAGDWILVHAGYALERIDEQAAAAILRVYGGETAVAGRESAERDEWGTSS